MRDPYKVMVYGPGKMGSVAIWEVLQSPAFELVGVRVYSEAKHHKDVGELLGLEPVGLKASNDESELSAIECDCIIYTALDMGNFNTDDEVLALLASGRNVVTPLPYHNAALFREQGFVDKLNNACAEGNSVFHATGIDPDVISERVLMALTGLCTDVTSITLREFWECGAGNPESLSFVGFGKTVEEAQQMPIGELASKNFLKAIVHTAEKALGVKYDRVEEEYEYIPTPKDIESAISVPAGTVACLSNRMKGYVDNKGSQPFFTMEYNWLIDYSMLPEGIEPDQYWVATIEGRPSMKMTIDLKASIENNTRFFNFGNQQSEPGYHGTIAPCLQAIPHICKAESGVIETFGPGLHWKQDLRESV